MNNRHLIDNAMFDTTFAGSWPEETSVAQVDEFIKNNLLRVIDEVFDQVDGGSIGAGSIMRLEKLEIDLGEIAHQDYRREMSEKLRQHLLRALGELRLATGDPSSALHLIDPEGDAQTQLLYFLRNGYLPWYARSGGLGGFERLDSMLAESVDASPEFLLEFMRANAGRGGVLERLANQFSPRTLRRVMRLLASVRGSAARRALARLESMLPLEGSAAYPGVESVSTQASADVAPTDRARPGYRADQADQAGQIDQTGKTERAADIDRLQGQLVAALLSDGAGEIESLWPTIMSGYPGMLEQTLRQYGQQAAVRRRILAGLSDASRVELLRLLETGAYGLPQMLLDHAEVFQPRPDDPVAYRAPGPTELWEFSLGYLLVERGHRFDDKSYLLSLLRQIAVAGRFSPAQILARLKLNLEALHEAGETGEWITRLAELTGMIESSGSAGWIVPGDPVGPGARIPDRQESESGLSGPYRRYRRVKSALTAMVAGLRDSGPELIIDIEMLLRATPWLMQKLFRELQSGAYNWQPAAARLPASILADFCFALLSLNDRADQIRPHGSATELVAAIRGKAARSADRQSLFVHILGRLIAGQSIDLDAIPARANVDDTILEIPDASVDSDYRAVVDSLDVLPGLAGMDSNACDQMLRCAELLTTAAYTTETGLSAERFDAIKWQFIRDYTGDTGYLFNQNYFVRGYVEHLIRQARIGDSGRFRASLTRALSENSLPATRDLTRRLIEILGGGGAEGASYAESPAAPGDSRETGPLPREDIYVGNAGLVLLAPYLPRLFDRLDLVKAGEFVDRGAAERAVHCLQFLVNADLSSPEYRLVLNKLFCGVEPGRPIRRGIEIDAVEREQLEGLLRAVTQHWKPLENTSTDGLRESFLQRSGRLRLDGDCWHLSVEARAFDMLLDQLPWSFNTIRFAWMERVIYVEWR